MTDRVKGFWVALDKDIRDDDFEFIKNAVLAIKHVQGVNEIIANSEDWMNRLRIQTELRKQLFEVLSPDLAKAMKEH